MKGVIILGLMMLEGLPAIVLGAVAWFYLPDGPHAWRGLSDADRQAIRTALAQEQYKFRGGDL